MLYIINTVPHHGRREAPRCRGVDGGEGGGAKPASSGRGFGRRVASADSGERDREGSRPRGQASIPMRRLEVEVEGVKVELSKVVEEGVVDAE
jgi:hypothetical protein